MEGFRQSWALIFGIDHYRHGIPSLRTAVADAEAVADSLQRYQGFRLLRPPMVEDVRRARMLELLEAIPEEVDADDRLLLYFAGHGLLREGGEHPGGYLVPQDVEPGQSPERSMISMHLLADRLSRLRCRHLLLVLDCCFAGTFRAASVRRNLAIPPETLYREELERYITDPCWQVLTSAAHDQKAHDSLWGLGERQQVGRHSPFAAALLDGLTGAADLVPRSGDGLITASELYLHLRQRVEPATWAEGSRQTPGLWAFPEKDVGEFVFAVPGAIPILPPAPRLDPANDPYRGLAAYREKDASLFFGREPWILSALQSIRERPLTVLTGPSGSGKTSLLMAGVLPRLMDDDTTESRVKIVPCDSRPERAMARLFGSPRPTPEAGLADWLAQLRDEPGVLAFDAYETFGMVHNRTIHPWDAWLAKALEKHGERLRVVLTIRSVFEIHHARGPLAALWTEGCLPLPPPDTNDLRRMMLGPASRRGLYIEPELVEILVAEMAHRPGALPLLSFALSELYRVAVQGGTRRLGPGHYASLGGLAGCLDRRAEESWAALPNDAHRSTLRCTLLRGIDDAGPRWRRRPIPLSELESADEAENRRLERVLEQWTEARLLVRRSQEVELVHDALVTGWRQLLTWSESGREDRALRRRLARAVADGGAASLPMVWNPPWLDLARSLHRRKPLFLNRQEAEVLRRVSARRRALRLVASSVVLAMLIASMVTASLFHRQSEENRKLRYDTLVLRLTDPMRNAVDNGPVDKAAGDSTIDSHRRLQLTLLAYRLRSRAHPESARLAEAALRQILDASYSARAYPAASRGSELRLAGIGSSVELADAPELSKIAILDIGTEYERKVEVVAERWWRCQGGTWFLGLDQRGRVWSWLTGPFPDAPTEGPAGIRTAACASEATVFAFADDHGRILLTRNPTSEEHEVLPSFCSGPVEDMRFDAEGRTLALLCDGMIRVWQRPESGWWGDPVASVPGAALAAPACRLLGRDLTIAEWHRYVGPEEPPMRLCPETVQPPD